MLAARALERCGYTVTYELSGGAADANVFNERGLQCVNLANGMTSIHTPDEHIAVADLEAMVDVTLALVETAVSQPMGALLDSGKTLASLLLARCRLPPAMRIGVAKEIKPDEYRVALTPAGALELINQGHDVAIETRPVVGSAFADCRLRARRCTHRRRSTTCGATPTWCSR